MKLRWIALTISILAGWAPLVAGFEVGDQTFSTENAGKVIFKHSVHLKKKTRTAANLSCKSCHNDKMKKGIHYSMDQMKEGKSCGMCHGKTAFSLSKCTACHKVKDVAMMVKETGSVRFRHSTHTAKFACGDCHNKYFKTGKNPKVSMAEMEKGKSCGACHNGKAAFSISACNTCHPIKEIGFTVKGAGNVTFSHTSHIGIYKCGECHPKIYGTSRSKTKVSMKAMEEGKSCGACHDEKTAFAVKGNCATCHHTK
ncbi:MAG TPA: c(7)-type cytochrome triheme domain-containing protein [Desulfuromonadaceae bacterium]